jgi:hypothetical protein
MAVRANSAWSYEARVSISPISGIITHMMDATTWLAERWSVLKSRS